MQKKSSIIPINEKMMEIMIFTTMMMMMVMMIVIMIKMMITMTMTISILHIIYCIAFRLLTSKLINTSMTRVKISCFYSFNQKMWKSRYNFGTKRDFAFIFSLVTPITTPGQVANQAQSLAVMKFLSKLSPKCTNE